MDENIDDTFNHRHTKQDKYEADEEWSRLLEQIYVHDVYERIADDFEHQSYQPLTRVTEFLMSLEPGSLVADIGCGNGHYLNVNPSITVMGVDRCFQLLESAQTRSTGVSCRADCLNLPYRDESFDAVLCIGVIHHLVSAQRQAKALSELSRILRPSGKILLYTWAWEQPKRKFEGQNILVPRHISDNPAVENLKYKLLHGNKQHEENFLMKIENLLMGPKSLLKRISGGKNKTPENFSDVSSISSIHSIDSDEWVICDGSKCSDDHINIPIEFQVREFPASSLFEISKPANQNMMQDKYKSCHRKPVRYTLSSQAARSRDERFYHVFRKGELTQLVEKNLPNLSVTKCSYKLGHWCLMLTKLPAQ